MDGVRGLGGAAVQRGAYGAARGEGGGKEDARRRVTGAW